MQHSDQLACMIDPRTMSCKHLPEAHRKQRRDTYTKALKHAYISYAETAVAFHKSRRTDVTTTPIEVDGEDDEAKARDGDEKKEDKQAAADTGWSDDEEDHDSGAASPPTTKTAAPTEPEVDWGEAFDKHYKAYRKRVATTDWRAMFPELDLPQGELGLLDDLIECDITRILDTLIEEDPARSKYGFMPYMATGFKGSIGSLLASSFAERINSCANLVLTDGNSLLAPEELSMVVVLRT